MNADTIRMLYDYNYWAHHRVWNSIARLSSAQFTQPLDYSVGSIRNQVVHVMGAEWLWFSRLKGDSPSNFPNPLDYPTSDSVRVRWDVIERDNRAYLRSLTDEELTRDVQYTSTEGTPHHMTAIGILMQVVNHGTDHRAQILQTLHDMGMPTIEQDLIFYMLESQGG